MAAERTILIIDDDPLFVQATTAVLQSRGCRVQSARNGEEGLAKMREYAPDLVLLDVMMGWLLEGITISRKMARDSRLRRIPLVMVTSIRNSEYQGALSQDEFLHIDGWLDKPCPSDRLISVIEAVLAKRETFAPKS